MTPELLGRAKPRCLAHGLPLGDFGEKGLGVNPEVEGPLYEDKKCLATEGKRLEVPVEIRSEEQPRSLTSYREPSSPHC